MSVAILALIMLLLLVLEDGRKSVSSAHLGAVSPEVLANIPKFWTESVSLERLQFLDKLELAESIPYPRYKTLILETEQDKYIAICLKQTDRLCSKKLCSLGNDEGIFPMRRSTGIKFAKQEIAESITGFRSGSIPPIGFVNEGIATYVDISATKEEKIVVGSGYPGISGFTLICWELP